MAQSSTDDSWCIVDSAANLKKNSVSVPTKLDIAFFRQLFPDKEESKLQQWLQVLSQEEFCTIQDLLPLNQCAEENGWGTLKLPLAVKTKLKDFVTSFHAASRPECKTLPAAAPIQQLDCIVLDVSGSMKSRSNMDPLKTREDVSKLMFHTMVDRILGLEMDHAVALVAFGRSVTIVGGSVTTQYENFHTELGRLDANQSATKLWDAIAHGADLLMDFARENKSKLSPISCPMRVFALTDGEDNASQLAAWEVTQYLQKNSILLDSFPMGAPNRTLQAMSAATGGLCVNVKNEEQGVSLFEREALLHVASRETVAVKSSVQSSDELLGLVTEMVETVEAAKPTALHNANVVKKEDIAKVQTGSSSAMKRVLKEYNDHQKQMASDPPSSTIAPFMTADNIMDWKVIMSGPANSPYAHHYFVITVQCPSDYPFKPPRVRFATKIYHCNVNNDGGICLDILKDAWSPALTIPRVMLSIQSMLSDPNADDPLDAFKAQVFKTDKQRYIKEAAEWAEKYAFASFEEAMAAFNLK